MGRFKGDGYLWVTWKGDHMPRHVHVYEGRRMVLKWDLENDRAMTGTATRRLRKLMARLRREGKL